jgi:RNA-dependent RNA polymerase
MHRATLDGGFRDFSRGRPKYQSSRPLRAATSGMYGNRPQETRQQQPAGPILRSQQAWEGWPEVNVKLSGLPPTISTWDLWERFAAEGDIVFIELFENRNGGRNGEGKIRFRQPRTLRPFWKGQVLIEDPEGDGMKIIRASLQQGTRRFQIESPVRKGTWYKEVLQIPTSATEFGHMVEEDTMMVMKSCPSGGDETRSSLSPTDAFHVDFKRQELEIKFSLVFRKDPSNESVENVDRSKCVSFLTCHTLPGQFASDGVSKLLPQSYHRHLHHT